MVLTGATLEVDNSSITARYGVLGKYDCGIPMQDVSKSLSRKSLSQPRIHPGKPRHIVELTILSQHP